MTARTSLAAVITQLRLLVNDTDSLMFTDDQLQDVLDLRAYLASYETMTPIESILPGGTVEYLAFQSDNQYYDTDAVLLDSNWNELTPTTSDFKMAYFTFTTSQELPVLIYGWYYDMNGAAADVWDMKAAKYADGFDFSADGGSFSLSQKVKQAQDQAAKYRTSALEANEMTVIVRTDVIV